MSFEYEQRQKKPGGAQGLESGHGLGQMPNLGQSPSGGDAGRRSVRIADSSVRKYLLLLHDCLAIKFVPLLPLLPRFNGEARNGRNTANYENGDHPPFGCSSARSSGFGPPPGQRQARPASAASNITMTHFPPGLTDSATPEVDHSLHGLHLYKGFRDANLQCYWNSALYDAFRNLEYKGYIVPSTVLIWAIPRFLTTLRTAWARQMLRSPPGYRIEFIGEIEELIADPVQQSQFAPLSDSLCWAILEITSLGQEAFVDSILGALSAAFPTMMEPGRELVYQTLEKLIKERKVYQTSHGYFVVTPDTFRYMSSSNNNHHYPHQQQQQPFDSPAFSTNTLTLDALMTSPTLPQPPNNDSEDKLSFSRNSWDSTASAENPVREREFGSELKPNSEPALRRHNSLKIIRQKDKENNQSASKTLGRRTLSFRLYKSKSTPNTGVGGKDKSSSREDNAEFPTSEPKAKSGKSFFRKLFKRSSSKGKKATTTLAETPTTPVPNTKASASTSTQTPCNPADTLNRPERITLTRPRPEDDNCSTNGGQCGLSQLGYSTELLSSRWDSLPKPERPVSRVMDDGPLYATPGNVTTSPDPVPPSGPSRPNSMFNFQRGESSRCSTLSHGTSLGYGSQGPASLGFHSQSPTPSMSPSGAYPSSKPSSQPVPNLLPRNSSNYNRSYYDFYRRRYPSYGSSTASALQTRPPTPLPTPNKPSSHCYETIGYPRQKSVEPKASAEPKSEIKSNNTTNCSNKAALNGDPFVSTTTVTQNVKSTTNMELEFRLPLGKLGNTNNFTIRGSEPTTKVNVNVGGEGTRVPRNNPNGARTSTTISVAQQESQPKTEVKTTVNHNGRIETSFDCSDESNKSSNNVEIELGGNNSRRTNVFLINSKSGERQLMSNGVQNEPKAYRKISDIGLYRNNNNNGGYPPVRVTDICKDSDEEFM